MLSILSCVGLGVGGWGGAAGGQCGMGGVGGIIGGLVLKDVQSKITKCNRKLELQPSISDSYRSAGMHWFFDFLLILFQVILFSTPHSKGFKQNFYTIYLHGMSQSLNKKYKTQKSDFCCTLCNSFPAQKLGKVFFVFVLITAKCFLEADNSSPHSLYHLIPNILILV